MKLTKRALRKLDNKNSKLKLALALGFSEQWAVKLLSQNKPNGPLTTISAINFIEQETGLKQEEILEATIAKVGATLQR